MNLFFLTIALACAGFVQGLSGFGFGLVSMSLIPLFMSVKQAAIISTTFTLMATLVTFARHYRDYEWRLGLGFLISVGVGLPLRVYFLERSGEEALTRALGFLMLIYAGREFFLGNQARPTLAAWSVPLGLFSGAMSGAFNLGGVPSAAYAYSHSWTQGQIMAFLQVMITLSCVLRMVFYKSAGLLAGIPWTQTLLLMVPVYMAIWLGHLTLRRSNPQRVRNGIFILIGLAGIYYLFLRPHTQASSTAQ